ncbi:hypothetical protein [Bradyrhizobium sp. JYMT SZCCT0180]|uniref:hypothetical protein n=1 Tax=Bradyrhizobium sp. JYMT SZCCT0180 TaxID=2807666 RepID=UPI001BA6B295|nr:hypothetical protein [Bradyrhizobium sp. JYMT SZCCT0180]MBR1211110.1 hypothetical protein [Bradyrhizobium sp. JYMT SZCCT0180]
MAGSKNPFLAKSLAVARAGAKRVSPWILKPIDRTPTPRNASLQAMKSADYVDEQNISLYERLDEITPSAHGKMTARKRDELRKKHGLPTSVRAAPSCELVRVTIMPKKCAR